MLQELTAERAYEILKRVSDEECQVMGFNPTYAHPAWMVLTVLPVPPPAVRPSVAVDSAARQVTKRLCYPPSDVDKCARL